MSPLAAHRAARHASRVADATITVDEITTVDAITTGEIRSAVVVVATAVAAVSANCTQRLVLPVVRMLRYHLCLAVTSQFTARIVSSSSDAHRLAGKLL